VFFYKEKPLIQLEGLPTGIRIPRMSVTIELELNNSFSFDCRRVNQKNVIVDRFCSSSMLVDHRFYCILSVGLLLL